MGEYFKPFRRKIGVITLVMACVFSAGWIRSRNTSDFLRLNVGRDQIVFSFDGRIYWGTIGQSSRLLEMRLGEKFKDASEVMARRQLSIGYMIRAAKANLRLESLSKDRALRDDSVVYSEWIIPYWSIVIPLTLLSAWLLLRNPRRSTENKPSLEPAA